MPRDAAAGAKGDEDMSRKKYGAGWWPIKMAPIGKPVLVWIPGPVIAGCVRPRIEVAALGARFRDPRSGLITTKYDESCRWTNLPTPPPTPQVRKAPQ